MKAGLSVFPLDFVYNEDDSDKDIHGGYRPS